MPLQGLSDESKITLLQRVAIKELSIAELRDSATSIKKKKAIVAAFMKYTGADSWEDLQGASLAMQLRQNLPSSST
jgi:putative NADH-flavin reductase